MPRFEFRFAPPYLVAGLPFGVTPRTTHVEVEDGVLHVRFGLWILRTPVTNVAATEVTGPYSVLKTLGPAHLSLSDGGITFATNRQRGLCVRLRQPVPAIEPLGRVRHPGLTVTIDDVDGLARLLAPGAERVTA